MRTLRQIPKVVGQTDDGETIYEVRSARLILRGDAAHFNRLVRCSRCGREVPGRAVLGPADLDHLAQAVVCSDCVEAATEVSTPPSPPAAAVAIDEPALADAQAEMNLGLEDLVDELAAPADEDPEAPQVLEPADADDGELVDGQDDEVLAAEEEPPAVNLQLMDDVAVLHDDGLPAPDEDEALMAGVALDEIEAPAPADDEILAGVEEAEPQASEDEAPIVAARPVEAEPEPPVDQEPVVADGEVDEAEPPALPLLDLRPDDEDLAGARDVLEERLVAADEDSHLAGTELRIVEMINRLIARTESQAERQVALEARVDGLAAAAVDPAKGKKETDKLRRQLDQMGERLEQLQTTIDAEWARSKAETATLTQTMAELGQRVLRLAQQGGDTAGIGNERLAAVEEKVHEATTRLAQAMESQRRELREGLAEVRAAVPPAPAAAEDVDGRLRAMEKQVRQGQAEVSELGELHAALDAGLGALRAELGDVRTALGRMADSKADLDDRLETFVRMSLVPEGDKGRKAKKTAESTLGALSAAVQDLFREQRQLKDSVATLEQASDAATAAAGRASIQASSLAPLRSEMKLLHQELVEHQEALEALRRTVERLRPPPSAAPPPAKAAPPAKKGTPAPAAKAATAKAPAKAAPITKAAAAKAALARAAAEQAKAPAAKRAPRAKKV